MLSYEQRSIEDRLSKTIEFRQERIKRLEILRSGADSKFWKALKADVEISIKTCQAQIESMAQGSIELAEGRGANDFQSAMRFWGGQLRAYKGVLSDVENTEDKIAALNAENSKDKEKIKSLREHNNMDELTGATPSKGRVI